jgi:hypothetical protein
MQQCSTFSISIANLAPRPFGDIVLSTWPPPFDWVDGFSGTTDLTILSNQAPFFYYSQMIESLTNGLDEPIAFWGSVQGCNMLIPDYGPVPESGLFKSPSDIVGHQIDFIRLIVNDLRIDQMNEMSHYDLSVSYEFWGTPIPAPTAAMLFVLPFLAMRSRRLR